MERLLQKHIPDSVLEDEIKFQINVLHFNNVRTNLVDLLTGKYINKAKRFQGDAVPRVVAKQLIQYFEKHKVRLQIESEEAIAALLATGYKED